MSCPVVNREAPCSNCIGQCDAFHADYDRKWICDLCGTDNSIEECSCFNGI